MNPSIEYIRNALNMVVDFSEFFKERVYNLTKTEFTSNLIKILKKFENEKENKMAIQYACKILGVNENQI